MMKHIQVGALLVCFISYFQVSAQQSISDFSLESLFVGQEISPNYFLISETTSIEEILNKIEPVLNIPYGAEIQLLNEQIDPAGNIHYYYKYFYDQLEIENSGFDVHKYENEFLVNLKSIKYTNVIPLNLPSNSQLITDAIDFVNLEHGYGLIQSDVEGEVTIGYRIVQESLMPYATVGLVGTISQGIVNSTLTVSGLDNSYHELDSQILPIEEEDGFEEEDFGEIVSPSDAALLQDDPCPGQGIVNTLYNDYQCLTTNWGGDIDRHRLIDNSRVIETRNRLKDNAVNPFLNDSDNRWTEDGKKREQASLHWAAQKGYDYFVTNYNTFGPTDVYNRPLKFYFSTNLSVGNSYRNEQDDDRFYFNIQLNDKSNPAVSLDCVGHEMFHSYLCRSQHLNWCPKGQSTPVQNVESEEHAIMEGMCDIFGEMIEKRYQGSVDWKYGAQARFPEFQRQFTPPKTIDHQSFSYQDSDWFSVADGHVRGGVLLHWAFLLSNGGSYLGQSVSGIGIDKFEYIFNQIPYFMKSQMNIQEFAEITFVIANSKHGFCSTELTSIIDAWKAVNVDISINLSNNAAEVLTSSINTLLAIAALHYDSYTHYVRNYGDITAAVLLNTMNTDEQKLRVALQSTEKIQLKPGFGSGNNFSAQIVQCTSGSSGLTNGENTVENFRESISITEITDLNKDKVDAIYPNPADDFIIVPQLKLGHGAYTIVNSLGTQVSQGKAHNGLINTEDLAPGIYFVHLGGNENKRFVKR